MANLETVSNKAGLGLLISHLWMMRTYWKPVLGLGMAIGQLLFGLHTTSLLSKEENHIPVSSTNMGQFYSCLLPVFGLYL